MAEDPAITNEDATNEAVSQAVGQPNNTEVVNVEGQATGEKVVYEFADPADPTKITGWHKEAING